MGMYESLREEVSKVALAAAAADVAIVDVVELQVKVLNVQLDYRKGDKKILAGKVEKEELLSATVT